MASRYDGLTLKLLVLFVVLFQLCRSYALDDADKYRNVQKRIFCNFLGCRNMNGKRDYSHNGNKRYHMFNRPSQSKRSHDALETNFAMENYKTSDNGGASQYSMYEDPDWTAATSNKQQELFDKSNLDNSRHSVLLGNELSNKDQILFGDGEEESNVHYKAGGIDVSNLSLYEKYSILKDAEEIIQHMKSPSGSSKRRGSYTKKDTFRRWLEKRR